MKWYVIAKWTNPQSGHVHRHAFRSEGNTIAQGIEAAISEAVQVWSCNRQDVVVYDVGVHESLAETADYRRRFNEALVRDAILQNTDVENQIIAIANLVQKGTFK